MPIRHGGMLAKRASTWPRDHFWRSIMAPLVVAYNVERVLADIDANHGNCSLGHGVLLGFGAPSQRLTPVGAGARPDHSITSRLREFSTVLVSG